MSAGRFLLLGLILVLVVSFFVFDGASYLSLDALKQQQAQLAELYQSKPFLVITVYSLVYLAVTTLSLPGAAILTLAAGALFGLVVGTVVVSFVSTLGATLAFLSARFLLRDSVQNRFGEQLKGVNDGVNEEGGFYLFTLRLVPVVPFFMINLLMGLTPIKTWTFYWISQLGMLAGTAVYVNAGTQLAQIESLGDILSLQLLLAFVLLGTFPLLAKRLVKALKNKKSHNETSAN